MGQAVDRLGRDRATPFRTSPEPDQNSELHAGRPRLIGLIGWPTPASDRRRRGKSIQALQYVLEAATSVESAGMGPELDRMVISAVASVWPSGEKARPATPPEWPTRSGSAPAPGQDVPELNVGAPTRHCAPGDGRSLGPHSLPQGPQLSLALRRPRPASGRLDGTPGPSLVRLRTVNRSTSTTVSPSPPRPMSHKRTLPSGASACQGSAIRAEHQAGDRHRHQQSACQLSLFLGSHCFSDHLIRSRRKPKCASVGADGYAARANSSTPTRVRLRRRGRASHKVTVQRPLRWLLTANVRRSG